MKGIQAERRKHCKKLACTCNLDYVKDKEVMAKQTSARGTSHNPLTVDEALGILQRAKHLHGGDTRIGVMLHGNNIVMPLLNIEVPNTRSRVTCVANFSDAGQKHCEDLQP